MGKAQHLGVNTGLCTKVCVLPQERIIPEDTAEERLRVYNWYSNSSSTAVGPTYIACAPALEGSPVCFILCWVDIRCSSRMAKHRT